MVSRVQCSGVEMNVRKDELPMQESLINQKRVKHI